MSAVRDYDPVLDRIVLHPGGVMRRFDGKPYWDGQRMRCADCNGFVELERPLTTNSGATCLTCGAVSKR